MEKKYFGVMLDMSRNGVMKVDEVKKYALIIKKMGFNMLQLYMEDVYEVNNEPYFGYLRGKYLKSELKEIVSYCNEIDIEVVPCIQTLAHLENALRWAPYKNIIDYDNILLLDDERTYVLIENMFSSLKECFTSEYIHIGMDEAYLLGLGRYMELHGYVNRVDLLKRHLKRVMDLANKYQLKPLMWSDMFFRLANNGQYYPEEPTLTKEVIDSVPKNLGLVYWDYYDTDKEYIKKMMKAHQLAGDNVWFAGGAWTWAGFASGNRFALETMIPAMKAARECHFENILMTVWGDFGRECSYYSILPALFTIRQIYEGNEDIDDIKKKFFIAVGEDYDKLMDLDLPNYVGGNKCVMGNICKHMLYNDPFLGFLDSTVKDGVKEEYLKHALTLKEHEKGSKFDYLFAMSSSLCNLMAYKYDLGKKTREAYKLKDEKKLKEVIKEYDIVLEKLEDFYLKFKTMWFKECKPNGFEVHDIKIGGLKQRLIHCKETLNDYLNKKIDSIMELEEEILDYYGNGLDYDKKPPYLTSWSIIASVSKI